MRKYLTQLHLPLIIALVLIVIVLSVYGWSSRPPADGFATVNAPAELQVTANGATALTETLQRTADNGAVLGLDGGEPSGEWTVVVWNLGNGYLCTPADRYLPGQDAVDVVVHQKLGPYTGGFTGGVGPNPILQQVVSHGYLYVQFCWHSHGPVSLNGAYLNAQLVPVYLNGNAGTLTSVLIPDGGNTANDTLQSLTPPTSQFAGYWQWSNEPNSSDSISATGINSSVTQHDTYLNFLSGIAFGVAGGALITLIQELFDPLRFRRRHEGESRQTA
jgi:hypothetical protein